jgi:hypothetical protein
MELIAKNAKFCFPTITTTVKYDDLSGGDKTRSLRKDEVYYTVDAITEDDVCSNMKCAELVFRHDNGKKNTRVMEVYVSDDNRLFIIDGASNHYLTLV